MKVAARGAWPCERYCGTSATVVAAFALALPLALAGCQFPDKLPPELIAEHWRIVGIGPAPAERTQVGIRWVATFELGRGKKLSPIASTEIRAPDGWRPDSSGPFAYNRHARMLVYGAVRRYAERPTHKHQLACLDMWLYDLTTKRSKWIVRKRWQDISSVAWSPDGAKLAFTASNLPFRTEARRASLCVYDLATDKLTEIADDGIVRYRLRESFPPVWSEDGKYLYYAAITRTLTRIELATLVKERLPIAGLAVLTVKGNEIVYLNDHIPRWEPEGAAQVIKRRLDSRDPEVGSSLLYVGCEIKMALVSPSRRFILLRDRRSYWYVPYVLIDTQTRKNYTKIWKYFPESFSPYATSLSERNTVPAAAVMQRP